MLLNEERNLLNLISLKDEIIFFGGSYDSNSVTHSPLTGELITKKVTDFDVLTILGNNATDGEMIVD